MKQYYLFKGLVGSLRADSESFIGIKHGALPGYWFEVQGRGICYFIQVCDFREGAQKITQKEAFTLLLKGEG